MTKEKGMGDLLLEMPSKKQFQFREVLKGKSSTLLYLQFRKLKYKYQNKEFWCKGVVFNIKKEKWIL
ncbi:hypothetical protein [Anaerotignum sp.]|uniref:hypothetical protein n=1 Tax=Anaerotignum sp. TaxID=2039241 RepID=UPI003FA4B08B